LKIPRCGFGVLHPTASGWQRLAPSARFGSRGDSYDNALAEAVNGLYKAEIIHKDGPWRSLAQVEFATAH
jgi:transposase InsO family protein